jgi:hypothetical protein
MSATPDYTRAVVSKPLGGLNDTLCQIQRALQFAENTGRHLFLDTTESGILAPFDDFFYFVDDTIPVTMGFPASERDRWNSMSVSPSSLEGRVSEFFDTPYPERFAMVGEADSRAIRLPPPDVTSDLVVHHQRGGGRLSQRLLSRIRLKPDVMSQIREMVSDLPENFAAVHIRATDYTTDHVSVLKRVRRAEKSLPVLVCSDNADVITDAMKILGESRVLFFPSHHDVTPGTPLHEASTYKSASEKRLATISLLRDVYAMSGAKTFYYAPIDQPGKFGEITFSGLTTLVSFLVATPQVRQSFFDATSVTSHMSTARLVAPVSTRMRLAWERKYLNTKRTRKARR